MANGASPNCSNVKKGLNLLRSPPCCVRAHPVDPPALSSPAATFASYLDSLEGGEFERAYACFSRGMKQKLPWRSACEYACALRAVENFRENAAPVIAEYRQLLSEISAQFLTIPPGETTFQVVFPSEHSDSRLVFVREPDGWKIEEQAVRTLF